MEILIYGSAGIIIAMLIVKGYLQAGRGGPGFTPGDSGHSSWMFWSNHDASVHSHHHTHGGHHHDHGHSHHSGCDHAGHDSGSCGDSGGSHH